MMTIGAGCGSEAVARFGFYGLRPVDRSARSAGRPVSLSPVFASFMHYIPHALFLPLDDTRPRHPQPRE